ncbi:MAG: hypothetical protein ACFB4J_20330 [Elainellaceae cyanobacterium]
MLRRHTATLVASLIGGLLGFPFPSQAAEILTNSALLAQAAGDTCGQTTGNTIIYDQPRRDSPVVAQIVQPGRRLTLDPNFAIGDWVRVTTPSVAGFTLNQYLESCRGGVRPSPRAEPPATGNGTSLDRSPGTVGSCAIALADRSAPQLSVRTQAGASASYNAIAAGVPLVLSAEPALYVPEQGRYWRKVLAYPPSLANRSTTGEAWISETGPNTPRLLRNSEGLLVTREGQVYPSLNIARRPCQALFPNSNIVEGRSLPSRLPNGYRTP